MPAQSARVELSKPLAEWKHEIEERGKGKVVLVRVYTDREQNELILPEDTKERSVLRRFFLSETFRGQFIRTHGMNVNYDGAEGKFYFVLLNMALAKQWEGAEDAAIAHEFGHAWLAALGYASPAYPTGPESCIAVHGGDIVQHVLIREEMKRRGIAYSEYWIRNLRAALEELESEPRRRCEEIPPCRGLELLGMWVDSSLGLSTKEWTELPRFLEILRTDFPELQSYAEDLDEYLRGRDLWDRRVYRKALDYTLRELDKAYEN
jgi:hypothetical protein